MKEFQANQDALSGALSRLLVVVEQYPDLKASASFRDLQAQLEGTENRIAVARKRFNDAAQAYNTKRRGFPTVLVANLMGFERKGLLRSRRRRRPGAEGPVLADGPRRQRQHRSASALLSPAELAAVQAATTAAEARTAGEIVPYLVEQADEHVDGRYRAALLGAVVATAIATGLHEGPRSVGSAAGVLDAGAGVDRRPPGLSRPAAFSRPAAGASCPTR